VCVCVCVCTRVWFYSPLRYHSFTRHGAVPDISALGLSGLTAAGQTLP
jgi:hypothetical protein